MAKVHLQENKEVLRASQALTGSDAGIGESVSGSYFSQGNSVLTGMLSISASLESGSGFQVLQSCDRGLNWDINSVKSSLAAGASPFTFDLTGDAVKIVLTNGSSANTIRTLWQVTPVRNNSSVNLLDQNGVSYGVKQVNGKPRVSAMPYLYDIAEGNIANHSGWSKLGYNDSISTGDEDVWIGGGTYIWPSAASQMQIASTSASDSATGAGARTAIIYYLDGNYAEKTDIVTLPGAGSAFTNATDIFRVQGFRINTAGSLGAAAGTLSLKNSAGTITHSSVAAGYTRARNITYTVPAGKALYVTSFTLSCYNATKGVRFTTRATYDSSSGAVKDFFLPYTEVAMTNGVFERELEVPSAFPATTRIKVSATADSGSTAVVAVSLRGWVETV